MSVFFSDGVHQVDKAYFECTAGWSGVEITDVPVVELGIQRDKIKTHLSNGTRFKHGSWTKCNPAAFLWPWLYNLIKT